MAGPYYSDNHAKSATDTTTLAEHLADRNEGALDTGRMLVAKATYTFLGTEAALENVRLFKLAKGDTIIPQLSYIFITVDAATTLTIDIGDTDSLAPSPLVDSDADRYADGIDCGAVGVDVFASGVAASAPYTLNEDAWITATFATLATPVAGGKMTVKVVYERGV